MAVRDESLDKPSVLSPKKVELPPAGYERDETLVTRLAALQQEAEEICTKLGVERIDPAKFRPDHDAQAVAHKMGIGVDPNAEVGIRGLRSDRAYVCVWRDPFGKLANRIFFAYKREGWEPVQAGSPEWEANPEAQAGDNTLHYADCLLMWMPKDRHDALKRKQLALRIAREEGVPQTLLELADRVGVKATAGFLPTEGGPESIAAQASRAADAMTGARHLQAREIAQRRFDQALRAGNLTR